MAIIMTIFFITVFIIIVSGYQTTIAVGLIIRNKGRGDGYQDY